jgi:hypothetical protein
LKKFLILASLSLLVIAYSCLVQKTGKKALFDLQQSGLAEPAKDSIYIIDAGVPEAGDPDAGYKYLLTGNAFSSGIPYELYKYVQRVKDREGSTLTGYNKFVLNDFVVFKSDAGNLVASPGCLHCHSQQFNNQLVIGLGNSYSNFQVNTKSYLKLLGAAIRFIYGKNSNEWRTAQPALAAGYVLAPDIVTEMQGPASAHRIAEVMASHRDPRTFVFRADTSYFSIPPAVIPTDITALWVSKKKNVFTVNAMEQGSFLKHLMSPALLSLKDTTEAREIYNNIKDVWAYILTLKAPKYPYPVNQELANEGKLIFEKTCSCCHGSYGDNEYYPNKIIPAVTIGTDSLMLKYYEKYPEYAEWFNKSWFATSSPSAFIKPQPGYISPPLDGIWVTAPYLHNGSVPTVEAVLNSKIRPRYWKRSFTEEKYDYEKLGWQYKTLAHPGRKKTYNTDIPGYGNYGHYFGDHLTGKERKAVIEYLKTL